VLSAAGRQNNLFEAGTTASTIGTTFEIKDLVADGIDSSNAVFHYNQHDYFYYISVSGFAITRQYMMNHGNIISQFTAWATQKQQSIAAGAPYLLGEMAAVGPQGLAGVTDVFGCALWSLDFLLYAATINVTRVLMHMTDVGNQSAWQPIDVGGIAPWVRPAYYGHIITSTLIGSNNDTTIAEIDIRSQELQDYAGLASAYVVYRGNTIYAAVVINMKEFNQTDTESSQTQLNFTINVPPAYAGNSLTVFKLSAPGADSFKGVTWAGLNFQTDDGIPISASTNDTTTTTVSIDGQLSIMIRDSQAAVVLFDTASPVKLVTASGKLSASGTLSPSIASSSTSSSSPPASTPSDPAASNSSADDAATGSKTPSAGQKVYPGGNIILVGVLCICMAIIGS
jgi:Glycosyl hydrolase family 79 C-terminal beta domain